MSLSSHIKSKASPVRAWFEATLPETRGLATDANRALRGQATDCPIPRVPGADPGLVGTAVDYLLRACLRVTSVDWTVASKAAQHLASHPTIDTRAIDLERDAVADIKKLQPSSRELGDSEWSELCIRCLVLARFEQFFRAGPMSRAIFDVVIEPLSQCTNLEDFIQLTLTAPTIRDLELLGRSAWDDSKSLGKARLLVLNPQFNLSVDLGGADADLIARRRLIDWKATTKTGIVGRPELWQLAGYALADTDDEHQIREVGISALRWRSTISWRLEDFIAELAPDPPPSRKLASGMPLEREHVDISALRQEFAQVVHQMRKHNKRAIAKMRRQLPKRPGSSG